MGQVRTEELTFVGATGLKLSGELMLPKGAGPFPAVLLLPGSGPTDRDGNQPPALVTNVLKQFAERFATSGVASFRFDKRPVRRYMAEWPLDDPAKLSEFFSFENHVADVAAAYKTMASRSEVDAKRCAILGHSEGGLFACWEAPRLDPAAIVLVGTAGQTLEGVLRYQIERSVAAAPLPDKTKNEIIASNEEAMRSIIETGRLPEQVNPNLASLFNPSALSLLRSYLTIDPTVPLGKYKGPVLVMNGQKDVQIRADVDVPLLMKALERRSKGVQEAFIVPGASHNLKLVESDDDPGFAGPVVAAALDKATTWLLRHLRASGTKVGTPAER